MYMVDTLLFRRMYKTFLEQKDKMYIRR